MKILVVDDEKNIRDSIARYLALEKMEVVTAENGLSAQRLLGEEVFGGAVIDLRMSGMDGLELLRWISREGPALPVIMISAYGEISDAVEAMKLGARDYIVKPFDPEELVLRLKRILAEQALHDRVEQGRRESPAGEEWIGESPPMREIRGLVEKIAPTPSMVLITGESGTGKEVIARAIHRLSANADRPFVPVNLGGVPETLLESELFGYEKGAFTGASQRKLGMFEFAASGTLFLDEIGDLPLHLQVKLLRVLQEKKIRRLGGTQSLPVDARILNATNRDLEALVKEGRFREDLYYRLNVIRIKVPPLRERKEDIPLLAGAFIAKFNRLLGRKIKGIDPAALRALQEYPFPGNVRELENLLERAVILAEGSLLGPRDLGLQAPEDKAPSKGGTVRELEKQAVLAALQRWEGNRTRAAEELGISRRTLLNKIRVYEL